MKADTSNEAFFDQVIESGADDISDLDGGMVEVVCCLLYTSDAADDA